MLYRKSLTALLALALTVGLTACSSKPPEEPEPPESQPSVSVMAPVEPEPALPYVNPLTGEGCARDIAQKRPVAVMLNNLKKALPQLGVSQADIIYEAPAEGGITRMLAVFQSVEEVGNIGSVRSARDYYVSLAMGHDALYLHAGGSPGAYAAIKNWGAAASKLQRVRVEVFSKIRAMFLPWSWSWAMPAFFLALRSAARSSSCSISAGV